MILEINFENQLEEKNKQSLSSKKLIDLYRLKKKR